MDSEPETGRRTQRPPGEPGFAEAGVGQYEAAAGRFRPRMIRLTRCQGSGMSVRRLMR